MHCWWRTLQPSQVKLIVKLSVSPCLDFFFCFPHVSGILHVAAWGQMGKCRNISSSEAGAAGGHQAWCLARQWQWLCASTLRLQLWNAEKKWILNLHFYQGGFIPPAPAITLCSVVFLQWCSAAGPWWYSGKRRQENIQILTSSKTICETVLVKILWNAAISQVSLLIAVNDVVARIYISDVASAF